MPHLSPLNWLVAPIIFWLLLSFFASMLWWSQSISFPKLSSSFPSSKSNLWKW